MPLLKLWNALCGRSGKPDSAVESSDVETRDPKTSRRNVSSAASRSAVKQGDSATSTRATTATGATDVSPQRQAGPSPSLAGKTSNRSRNSGGLFRGRPHAALCRQLKSLPIQSVLELGVDDGSRAVAVLETLASRSETPIRYAAIDQFELRSADHEASDPRSLKDFFQIVRGSGITPQLFPETVDRGLLKVGSTLGAVDLVLISIPPSNWQNPTTLKLLSRVIHEQSVVLFHDNQQWVRYEQAAPAIRRAA